MKNITNILLIAVGITTTTIGPFIYSLVNPQLTQMQVFLDNIYWILGGFIPLLIGVVGVSKIFKMGLLGLNKIIMKRNRK